MEASPLTAIASAGSSTAAGSPFQPVQAARPGPADPPGRMGCQCHSPAVADPMADSIVLTRRFAPPAEEAQGPLEQSSRPGAAETAEPLRLALGAEERTRLRGHRRSVCGRDLVLQLPRGEPLRPGERLLSVDGSQAVVVEAAPEGLLVASGAEPLDLLRAAYHLGNRHVALEVRSDELRLLEDPVLADLLRRLGLRLEHRFEPFHPEGGAYGGDHGAGGGHHHGGHTHERHGGEERLSGDAPLPWGQ